MYIHNTKNVQKRLFQLGWTWSKGCFISHLDYPLLFLRDNKILYAARKNGEEFNRTNGYIFTEKEFFEMFGELEIELVEWEKAFAHMKSGGLIKKEGGMYEYCIGTSGNVYIRSASEHPWEKCTLTINNFILSKWELL